MLGQDGESVEFRVKTTTLVGKMLSAYCERKGTDPLYIARVMLHDRNLKADANFQTVTCAAVGIKDGDHLVVAEESQAC